MSGYEDGGRPWEVAGTRPRDASDDLLPKDAYVERDLVANLPVGNVPGFAMSGYEGHTPGKDKGYGIGQMDPERLRNTPYPADPETVRTEPTLVERLRARGRPDHMPKYLRELTALHDEAANHITAQEEELRNLRQMNQTTRELLAGSHNRRTAQEDIIRELREALQAIAGGRNQAATGAKMQDLARQALARHALNSSDGREAPLVES